MIVRIEGIGIWKQRLGENAFEMHLEKDADIKNLMGSLQERCPDLEKMRKMVVVCVNENVVDDSHTLRDGDEILLMSALAGG
jgi:molybdopterin converting factor small subunit